MTVTALADPSYGHGGALAGGAAEVAFVYQQVNASIVVEWDLDNDGDFDQPEEDITALVLSLETITGRDWPSQLTGKAGPGQLRATLRNDDDRFSFFNAASPLTAAPFSLRNGRKIRVRTTTAADPDPDLLATDRFQRSDGNLGTADSGQAWSGPLADDLEVRNSRAAATSSGTPPVKHLAVLDAGAADYYAQTEIVEPGLVATSEVAANRAGLVFRYADTSNYSLLVVEDGDLALYDVVAGTATLIDATAVETYDGMNIGVLTSGASVTAYLEGTPMFTAAGVQTAATGVGLYAEWGTGNLRPQLDEFYVWDRLPAQTEGILWTGDTSSLATSVEAGPRKLAMITAEGWLSKMALQRTSKAIPGLTTGPMQSVAGRPTGVVVGNILAQSRLLHPPGPIDRGTVTTGPFGRESGTTLNLARDFEETELGFLYETQEGPIGFAGRDARAGTVPAATFSDLPGAALGYAAVTLPNWRREIVNQVIAGVSPRAPGGVTQIPRISTSFNANTPWQVLMPPAVDAGDLLLVATTAASGLFAQPEEWITPAGWKELSSKSSQDGSNLPLDDSRIYIRVADGTEAGTFVTFATTTLAGAAGSAAAHVYRISDWFGAAEGVQIGEFRVAGTDPGVLLVPWGLRPTLFLAFRFGLKGVSASISDTRYPLGYTEGTSTQATNVANNVHTAVQSAQRTKVVTLEDAGEFAGTFDNFTQQDAVVVAVRGFEGTPPGAGTTVQVDDLASQDAHNATKTHRAASGLFASAADATAYANRVVGAYADDRPILSMSFHATKTPALRAQAIRRRISDKITLVAEHNSGLGISGDFFIESVGHTWAHGAKLWTTTWQLSPA